MKAAKQKYDCYYGYTRITFFRGTKRQIFNRLNKLRLTIWADSLTITKENDFNEKLVENGNLNNFFSDEEIKEFYN